MKANAFKQLIKEELINEGFFKDMVKKSFKKNDETVQEKAQFIDDIFDETSDILYFSSTVSSFKKSTLEILYLLLKICMNTVKKLKNSLSLNHQNYTNQNAKSILLIRRFTI